MTTLRRSVRDEQGGCVDQRPESLPRGRVLEPVSVFAMIGRGYAAELPAILICVRRNACAVPSGTILGLTPVNLFFQPAGRKRRGATSPRVR
jgi:hypothetical protein